MRDVYEVMRAKEILIEQLRREIEALRLAAPLLSDNRDNGSLADAPTNRTESDAQSLPSIKRLRARLLRSQIAKPQWLQMRRQPAALRESPFA
jgi:hypothetical protein